MPDQHNQSSSHLPVLKHEPVQVQRQGAKDRNALAEAIMHKARDNGITIDEDPALTAALASVEIDMVFPDELFQVAAEIIAFIVSAKTMIKN